MAQYIPKDALVAEIEKRLDELYDLLPDASKVENGSITMSEACNTGKYTVLESFRRFLDTIEVKEVDLEKELCTYLEVVKATDEDIDFVDFAKHFFELGMRSTITEEDVKLIWTIGDEIPYMPEEEFFKELLKRYKTQKGEEV